MLAVAAIAIAPKPTPTIRSIENAKTCEYASTTSPIPSMTAPNAIRDGRGLLPNASQSAASSEPTPDDAIRKP